MNSMDVESGEDDLQDLATFKRWMRDHGQHYAATAATERDLVLARRFRSLLRDSFTTDDLDDELTEFVSRLPVNAVFEDETVTLAPAGDGVRRMLSQIVADIAAASARGEWQRIKLCPAEDCLVFYYDRSKNSSRRWCSMESCGNRAKVAAHARRRRATGERAG